MNVKQVAINLISQVDKGAYSNIALNETFKTLNINSKEKAFMTEIFYGVLRNKKFLDYIIEKNTKEIKKEWIRNLLRISIYQIIFMDKIPEFAIINEAVNLTKVFKLKKFSSFVNGSLRNFLRNKEDFIKIKADDVEEAISIKYSANMDIVKNLLADYGREETIKILENSMFKPHFAIRISSFEKTEEKVVKDLEKDGYKLKKSEFSKL